MTSIIQLKAIDKTYGEGDAAIRALCDVDLTIEPGEYVAIMGSSGSGKSTLMNILGCLDRPTSGTYMLNGQDVSTLSRRELADVRQRTIGFVFQSFNLLARLSALQNVRMPLLYSQNGNGDDREGQERAIEILEAVGLGERTHHLPSELSGGQQQRVAIARALIYDPPLILADEPTGNLDSQSGEEILTLLGELNAQGTTILTVTHEQATADHAARTVRLHDGEVVSDIVTAPREGAVS